MHKSRSQTFDFKDSVTCCIKQLITIVKVVWFVLQSLEWLPKVNNWDDFFDFSRWSFVHHHPDEVVAYFLHRVRLNVVHNFGGNYCWILLSAMILSGLLFHKLLLNTFILMVLWTLSSIMTIEIRFFVDATYYAATDTYKPIPSYKLPLNERIAVTVLLWQICTFLTGGLYHTYMVLIIAIGCCCIHAAARPILPSISKQSSSSDDEDSSQEEEIDFTHKADSSLNQKRLFFRGSQGSLVKLVLNEEVFHTKTQNSYQAKKVD